MEWGIIADSACDLPDRAPAGGIGFSTVPFAISVGGRDFVDDGSLDADERGRIALKEKVRGGGKALEALLADIRERGLADGRIAVSHCRNAGFAERLKAAVLDEWSSSEVEILPARGLCSYYAEKGGLIAAYRMRTRPRPAAGPERSRKGALP